MTLGEKLLNLTAEYHASLEARNPEYAAFEGQPVGREPVAIAADYEAALRELLTSSLTG